MLVLPLLDDLIDRALDEDLRGGDITSEACVDADATATGRALAKKPLVVCGGVVFRRVFERVDPTVQFESIVEDGVSVEAGTSIWLLSGRARSLLAGERTALNLAQRMCGTASLARRFVEALPKGSKTRIADTRKTTPGLRALERYAVLTGGAHNHRNDLGSAVLIKDNHIVAAGGVARAIERARERAPHTSRVECEVATLAELDEAVRAGADVVMLDNFEMADVREAVKRVHALGPKRPLVEVSGGITLERIRELGEVGVDVISAGALTHSAPASDISLDFSA